MSKFIIEADRVKREVYLPAAICLSRETASAIRDAMEQFLGCENRAYGWVTIHREQVDQQVNSPPLSWYEEAPKR